MCGLAGGWRFMGLRSFLDSVFNFISGGFDGWGVFGVAGFDGDCEEGIDS